MSSTQSKAIFVSYSDADRNVAFKLREALQTLLGPEVWLRDFDLDGGDLIIEATHEAMEEVKWFLLLLSEPSVKSHWVKLEANAATIRAFENLDVKIINPSC
jgi:hypothetical protein